MLLQDWGVFVKQPVFFTAVVAGLGCVRETTVFFTAVVAGLGCVRETTVFFTGMLLQHRVFVIRGS
jgi:hypothetical protein